MSHFYHTYTAEKKRGFTVGFCCEKCKRKQLVRGLLAAQEYYTDDYTTKRGLERRETRAQEALNARLNTKMEKVCEGLQTGKLSIAGLNCTCRYCDFRPAWANYKPHDALRKTMLVIAIVLCACAMFLLNMSKLLWAGIAIVCAALLFVGRVLVRVISNRKQDAVVQQMNRAYWPVLLEDKEAQLEYLRGESDETLALYGLVPVREKEEPAPPRQVDPALVREAELLRKELASCQSAAEMLERMDKEDLSQLTTAAPVKEMLADVVRMENLYGLQKNAALKKLDRLLHELVG